MTYDTEELQNVATHIKRTADLFDKLVTEANTIKNSASKVPSDFQSKSYLNSLASEFENCKSIVSGLSNDVSSKAEAFRLADEGAVSATERVLASIANATISLGTGFAKGAGAVIDTAAIVVAGAGTVITAAADLGTYVGTR